MKTLEAEVHTDVLGNLAYGRLTELLDGELGNTEPELSYVQEAKFLITVKEALAMKADFLTVRIRYDEEKVTQKATPPETCKCECC
jgi:hypothetical protein